MWVTGKNYFIIEIGGKPQAVLVDNIMLHLGPAPVTAAPRSSPRPVSQAGGTLEQPPQPGVEVGGGGSGRPPMRLRVPGNPPTLFIIKSANYTEEIYQVLSQPQCQSLMLTYLYLYAASSNGKRKPRRFSLILFPFAQYANGSLSFVCLLTKKLFPITTEGGQWK
jgi:hypothetical protein